GKENCVASSDGCAGACVSIAGGLPWTVWVRVRRRTASSHLLCGLPRLSGTRVIGQEDLAIRRLTGHGPTTGRQHDDILQRSAPESVYDGPEQGRVGRRLGQDCAVLSRAQSRHIAVPVLAGSASH